MVINKGFCTKICGDIDLKGMVILVCYDDRIIAEINYEKGIDKMEIELVSSQEFIFPLQAFLNVLEKAKKLITQCAKEDELKEKE